MLVALDRYEAGQVDAFTVIRVPTETEEQRRIPGRIGQRLKQTIRTLAQSARGHALLFGVRLKGAWYSPRRWPEVMKQLPASLRDALGRMRTVILCAAAEWQGLRALILQGRLAGEQLPVGVGRETAEGMEAEVCDWNRFANRGAVGNFSGLTPGEASSGPQRVQGSITKCGNGRLRWLAVQTAWRLVRFQPDYRGVQRFKKRALEGTRSRRRVRQWIVALAREFLIDWWRVRTGRTTTEKLGLRLTQA
jgi:transposase